MELVRKLGVWVLLAGLTAVIAGWHLGGVELNGHECYVALSARGMVSQDQWLDAQLLEHPVPPATPLNRWMIPQCNGEPRLRKTPLAYWAVAGLIEAGLPMTEATVRLPSVIASVLVVLVIFAVGRRMLGARAAFLGALMLAASLSTLKWGRNARPELLLMLFMTAAMACFWCGIQAVTGGRRAAWLLAGWACLGLANLSKEFVPLFLFWPLLAYLGWRGSIRRDARPRRKLRIFLGVAIAGVLLVDLTRRAMLAWDIDASLAASAVFAGLLGLPLLGYFLASRPWKPLLKILPTLLPGLVIMALLFVPWLWYLDTLFPDTSDTLWEQVGQRGIGSEEYDNLRDPGFYVVSLVSLVLPWVVFLPGAIAAPLLGIRNSAEDADAADHPPAAPIAELPHLPHEHADGLVFLLLWVVGLLILFSAAAGKRMHYILPAVPALALLIGYAAEDVFFHHRWFSLAKARLIMNGHAFFAMVLVLLAAGASEAASGGWISHMVGGMIKPIADEVAVAEIAGVASHLLWPLVLAAVAWTAGALAMRRSRPGLSFAALVAGAVVILCSLTGRPELLNESPNARTEVRWLKSQVPADTPLSCWGINSRAEPLVYYYGHDLPNAELARDSLIARLGRDEGLMQWQQWMNQRGGRWLLVRHQDVEEVRKMGYAVVDPNHKPADEDVDVVLMRPTGKGLRAEDTENATETLRQR